jgi:hypothetical protein
MPAVTVTRDQLQLEPVPEPLDEVGEGANRTSGAEGGEIHLNQNRDAWDALAVDNARVACGRASQALEPTSQPAQRETTEGSAAPTVEEK